MQKLPRLPKLPSGRSQKSQSCRKRTLSRGRFEGLERRDLLAVDALRITEMMYQPPPMAGSGFVADDFEFIELMNTGDTALNLNGVQFAAGVTFSFTGSAVTSLAPLERVLVVKNIAGFNAKYGGGHNVAGQYSGMLSNSMEQVLILDPFGNVVLDFHYADHWHKASNGDGFSLTVLDANAPSYTWGLPESWRASLFEGGSPGTAEPTLEQGDLVINEVLAHTDELVGDQMEIYNRTNRGINISGWWLSDNKNEWNRYKITDGKFVPAGGYLVFNQDQHFGDANDPNAIIEFGFSELGEEAHLASWDSTGTSAAYHEKVEFGASDREWTHGRYTRSDGSVVFVEMATPTMGAANSGPNVGPVVISEIMYNRPGTNQQGEFIELHNITDETVDFNHPTVVGNTWLIIDAVQFRFPQGVSLEAGGYLLIVGGNPETYRTQYNVPDNVQIFGPYSGLLSNTGEGLELSRPGDPEPTGEIPYYRMDYVEYSPLAPWPTEANGGGATLTRINDEAFGDDVVNWKASTQPGGTPGRANDYVEMPGDTNADGRVDITDLNNVRNHFGEEGPNIVGDANGDHRVDIADLNAVRNHFGSSAPTPAPVTASSAAFAVVEQDRDAVKGLTSERRRKAREADLLATSRTAAAPAKKQRLVAWDEALRAMTLS